MRCIALVLLSLFAPWWGASLRADDTAPAFADQERLQRLRDYEVLPENTRTDESGGSARVQALFRVEPQRIWAILTSCKRAFWYVDGLKSCEVIEPGLEHALVSNSVKKSWVVPKLDYTVEFSREPYSRIDFRKADGDLKLLEGYWQFDPLPGEDGLLVTHEIRVKPRFPVPRWLIRRSIRKDIPDMVACLRSLSGGSGSERQWLADNDRCPRAGRGREPLAPVQPSE